MIEPIRHEPNDSSPEVLSSEVSTKNRLPFLAVRYGVHASLALSLVAVGLFWAWFIMGIRPSVYFSQDDINFFGPRVAAYLSGENPNFWAQPQGPHLHTSYKAQSIVLMKYFNWNSHLLTLSGITASCVFAWLVRHRWRTENTTDSLSAASARRGLTLARTALVWLLINGALVLAITGHVNRISYTYSMLSLNNALIMASSALMLYSFAILLTDRERPRWGVFIIFVLATLFLFWVVAIAISVFLVAALIVMGATSFVGKWAASTEDFASVTHRLADQLFSFRLPLLAGLIASSLSLAYILYVPLSSGVGGPLSIDFDLLRFATNGAYTALGWDGMGFEPQLGLKTLSLVGLAIAVTLIFLSPFVPPADKLFLLGACIMVMNFAAGATLLRGQDALLFPRYTPTLGLLYMASVWGLGRLVWQAHTLRRGIRPIPVWRRFLELSLSTILLLGSISICVSGLSILSDRAIYVKRHHQPRVDFVFNAPIETVRENPNFLDICRRSHEQCLREILRMRCFHQVLAPDLCISGSSDEIIRDLERVSEARRELDL